MHNAKGHRWSNQRKFGSGFDVSCQPLSISLDCLYGITRHASTIYGINKFTDLPMKLTEALDGIGGFGIIEPLTLN